MIEELGRKFDLDELLDLANTKELFNSLSELLGLQIKIYTNKGKELLSCGKEPPFCSLINSSDEGEALCQTVKDKLLSQIISGSSALQIQSACGMKYTVFPLQYQFEQLGRAIVGPYQDQGIEPARLEMIALRQKLDPKKFDLAYHQLPELTSDQLKKAVRFLSRLFDAVIFITAKRLITSVMHLELIMQNREKIFAEMEKEAKGSAQDKKEIDKYKNMF